MTSPLTYASDIAFTGSVKAVQARKGSRLAYERMEQSGSWESRITPDLKSFIQEQTSVFLATASAAGQPYVQHRGGPAGFLRVLDDSTIGFADFTGNRQYITLGNLAENPRVQLFLIDFARQQRIKIWGRARVEAADPALLDRLMPPGYKARAEQAILLQVTAWDANCSKHIPQRFDAQQVSAALAERDRRIEQLQSELERLRAQPPG
jgi:predicted pyridoxine 5'-phosphate oxidase superfamily flavin-nucleotide-binding protein